MLTDVQTPFLGTPVVPLKPRLLLAVRSFPAWPEADRLALAFWSEEANAHSHFA